jgi:hypothetical protein
VHAVLDHLTAPWLLVLPRLIGWSPCRRRLLAVFGAFGLADALLTDFPGGVLRRIPLPVHLNLEAFAGLQLLLAALTVLRGEPAVQRWAVAVQGLAELTRATATRLPVGPAAWSGRRPGRAESAFCYEPGASGGRPASAWRAAPTWPEGT